MSQAELYRLKGEALLAGGVLFEAHAQACFEKAIMANSQRDRGNCERQPVSHGCSRSKAVAKRCARCVREIYGWFAEGFDTADLKDAKALLEELVAQRSLLARSVKREGRRMMLADIYNWFTRVSTPPI